MHDPVYRLGIAWQNVGYNQPPHTSFYLGHGMEEPPVPKILAGSCLVDQGTIHVLAHQEGQKAVVNISADEMNTAVKTMTANTVVIHVNGGENLRNFDVRVPSQSMKEAEGKSVKHITFVTNLGAVTLSANELSRQISEDSEILAFTISKLTGDSLSGDEKALVGDYAVYDLNLFLDGKQLSDFTHSNGNAIEVEVPYTLKPGEHPDRKTIYYLSDHGEIEPIKNAKLNKEDGTATFKLKHF